MRTAIIMAVGFGLQAACLGGATPLAGASPSSMLTATVALVVIRGVAAAATRWMGVSQAGYSLRAARAIALVSFSWPSALAIFVKERSWELEHTLHGQASA